MRHRARRVRSWLIDRLGLQRLIEFAARHPVPPEYGSRRGWLYVLGVATLAAFLLQFVTGAVLATKYIPAPSHAYESLRYITEEAWFGALLRGMHYVGASAMIVLMSAHVIRVVLTGSYKFPREMNWVLGVVLLVLVLTMALTGQLLRWDQDGMWTVSVAANFFARVPLIGAALARFVLAGESVGGATLSRFFVLHVLLLPLLIFAVIGAHLYLVLHHGISEAPRAGRPVDRSTYRAWYRDYVERGGTRYWPDAAWREVVAALLVVVAVVALAYLVGPKGPGLPPDPSIIGADPRPDWYLRWYYALLWVKPRGAETLVMVYLPLAVLLALLLLPFVFNAGERSPRRRPWAVIMVVGTLTGLGLLTQMGLQPRWAMDFDARPLTAAEVGVDAGPVWQGAQAFHARGCAYCHTVLGVGGEYGPDLTDVARRLPTGAIVARTLNGIGDMPGYRRVLSEEEMDAIVAFLQAMQQRR
jgi:ubiquinol-cytochrome c reductase cytochrome b subunit